MIYRGHLPASRDRTIEAADCGRETASNSGTDNFPGTSVTVPSITHTEVPYMKTDTTKYVFFNDSRSILGKKTCI